MDVILYNLASKANKRLDVVEAILPDKADLVSSGIVIPSGTTADRPTLGITDSVVRFNTDLDTLEGWDGVGWKPLATGTSLIDDLTIVTDKAWSSYKTDAEVTIAKNTAVAMAIALG